MDRAKAIEMIRELVLSEVDVTNQNNSRYSGPTKKAVKREIDAAKKIFNALVGGNLPAYPTDAEIQEMTGA